MKDIPLGKASRYPETYAPEMLAAVARDEARAALGLVSSESLPFFGIDLWNAWELSWLEPGGKPAIAVAEIEVPADSPNIVESKSLKLYLNSFAMSRYGSANAVREIVSADLSEVAGAPVAVRLIEGDSERFAVKSLPGECIDGLDVDCGETDVDADALSSNPDECVAEALHSHLLRSLCPVTSQPDFASVLVTYRGPRIDRSDLLRYVVSFRRHQDFHESCVERMFTDIMKHCGCESLSVYARYTRRGGIDINPYRSSGEEAPDNRRLWRQ